MYDISKISTFENIDRWYEELKKTADANITVVLVGNKCDLEKEREVTKEQGEEKARAIGASFFETSALSNIRIGEVFKSMIDEIYEKYSKLNEDQEDDFEFVKTNEGVDLIKQDGKKKGCC